MRVLQLIDTLNAGGAERMAVNLANAFSEPLEDSHLCATRAEGILKSSVKERVGFLFLNRRSTIDIKAILQLKTYIKAHKINIVHAHSSSYFIATLVKLIYPNFKLVWHDHYGKSEFLEQRPKRVLKFCSRYFSEIIVVNEHLRTWANKSLRCNQITYVNNFVSEVSVDPQTILKGKNTKRILCLANLRAQKDHMTLFKAFKNVIEKYPDWTLHCVGKDFEDDYSESLYRYVEDHKLSSSIYFYGTCNDVSNIISQSAMGVLASVSEGLPLALLEYGMGKIPVIATDVGDCSKVISSSSEGVLVQPQNIVALEEAIKAYITHEKDRNEKAMVLHEKVIANFSEKTIVHKIIERYNAILNAGN